LLGRLSSASVLWPGPLLYGLGVSAVSSLAVHGSESRSQSAPVINQLQAVD
jgi:hypothetical protein